jgi:ketosteroid isomerase-like protein
VRDTRADEQAVQSAVRDFVAAFSRRDAGTVVPLLPANARDAWRALLQNRGVTDFRATAGEVETPRVNGDAATVTFTVNISFRSQNADQNQMIRYEASAERAGSGWRLTALRQAGG